MTFNGHLRVLISDRVRYYQLLDNLVTQIVLDRKGLTTDDFSGGFGWSVASLIEKFAEQDQLAAAIAEAKEAKEMYEKAIKEKQELELEMNLKGGTMLYCEKYCVLSIDWAHCRWFGGATPREDQFAGRFTTDVAAYYKDSSKQD